MTPPTRLVDYFHWKQVNKFPGLPMEIKEPTYFLDAIYDHLDASVYFVNASSETLTNFRAKVGGALTSDDTVVSSQFGEVRYDQILPNQAVFIFEYNAIYDGDYVIQVNIEMVAQNRNLKLVTVLPKAGFEPRVLEEVDR